MAAIAQTLWLDRSQVPATHCQLNYGIYLWQAPAHYAVMAIFAAIGYPVSSLGAIQARLLVLAIGVVVVGLWALRHPTLKCHFAAS